MNSYDSKDLFLFSTDCQGNLRWTKTIGGSYQSKFGWNIEVDNSGGIYLLGTFFSMTGPEYQNTIPIHFDTNVTVPINTVPFTDQTTPSDGLITSYLLKYNTNDGSLIWHHPLQGSVSWPLRHADSGIFTMDSAKNIHAIIGFRAGTHLNGLITVPASFTSTYQYYLVKFDYDGGNMTPQANPLLLPITGQITQGMGEGMVNLVYDQTVDRYYLAGKRVIGGTGSYFDFSYGSHAVTENTYILAFAGSTGLYQWHREIDTGNPLPGDRIDAIAKDGSGNIYIGGLYNPYSLNNVSQPVTFNKPANQPNPSYSLPNPKANTPFVIKLNSAGDVLWHVIPSGYSPTAPSGHYYYKSNLTLNGNEIAFVKESVGDTWGTFPMVRPPNDSADPLLVRINKDTGAVLGAHDVLSSTGTRDGFTAVAADMDGNYVVGGFKHGSLFVDPNDGVPDLLGHTPSGKSQFFFAKLAASACSQMSTTEVSDTKPSITFYPNPADDVLHFETEDAAESFEVFAMSGHKVMAGKLKSGEQSINIARLATGTYMVKIKTKTGEATGKVIKK